MCAITFWSTTQGIQHGVRCSFLGVNSFNCVDYCDADCICHIFRVVCNYTTGCWASFHQKCADCIQIWQRTVQQRGRPVLFGSDQSGATSSVSWLVLRWPKRGEEMLCSPLGSVGEFPKSKAKGWWHWQTESFVVRWKAASLHVGQLSTGVAPTGWTVEASLGRWMRFGGGRRGGSPGGTAAAATERLPRLGSPLRQPRGQVQLPVHDVLLAVHRDLQGLPTDGRVCQGGVNLICYCGETRRIKSRNGGNGFWCVATVVRRTSCCTFVQKGKARFPRMPLKFGVLLQSNKLCAHPYMELYSDGTIHFMAPLARQDEFYVPEANRDPGDTTDDETPLDVAKPSTSGEKLVFRVSKVPSLAFWILNRIKRILPLKR